MSLDQQASENLQIIRSLMERSTIYRAISTPTAFVGGIASILMGFWGKEVITDMAIGSFLYRYSFFISWGLVFAVTLFTHLFQLFKDSKNNNEPIFSSRHIHAFKCMFPSFFTAGTLTFFALIASSKNTSYGEDIVPVVLVYAWTFFYGMALLSTQSFAPKSIQVLGWIFFISGFVEFFIIIFFPFSFRPTSSTTMALTFGLFHLIYAIAVKVTEAKQAPEPGSP